jgi:hypothetical protein
MNQLEQKTGLRDWREVVDLDFPDLPEITSEVIQKNIYACRHMGYGDARLATGMVWADKDYEAMRQEELSTPLP